MNKKEMTALARKMRANGDSLKKIAKALKKRKQFVKEILGAKAAPKKPTRSRELARGPSPAKPAPARSRELAREHSPAKPAAKPAAKAKSAHACKHGKCRCLAVNGKDATCVEIPAEKMLAALMEAFGEVLSRVLK